MSVKPLPQTLLNSQRISICDAELFERVDAIETRDEAQAFMDSFALEFSAWDLSDFEAMREIMRLAIAAMSIAQDDSPVPESLQQCGISYKIADYGESLGEVVQVDYRIELTSTRYAERLSRFIDNANQSGRWEIVTEDKKSVLIGSSWPKRAAQSESENTSIAARAFYDELCSLHYTPIWTDSVDGETQQVTLSPIAGIWLSMGHAMRKSRAIRCKSCGRPLLVSGERGKPREYCGDTCRKWAQRNPDKIRAGILKRTNSVLE